MAEVDVGRNRLSMLSMHTYSHTGSYSLAMSLKILLFVDNICDSEILPLRNNSSVSAIQCKPKTVALVSHSSISAVEFSGSVITSSVLVQFEFHLPRMNNEGSHRHREYN